jgi:hypothetical protein
MTMGKRLDDINAATLPAQINGNVSPSWHSDALAPHGAVLVDGDEMDCGSAAYQSGRSLQKAIYESMSQIDTALQSCSGPHQVGRQASTGKPIMQSGVRPELAGELTAAMTTNFERTAQSAEASLQTIKNSIAKLETDVAVALRHPQRNDVSVATSHSEIRAFVARMDEGKRLAFLHHSIVDDGDSEIAHAILESSPFVSGLTREQMAQVREWSAERLAPRATKQLRAAKAIEQHVRSTLQQYAQKYFSLLPPAQSAPAAKPLAALRGQA